jgi:hypothetical protein
MMKIIKTKGDLTLAAKKITSQAINFMARYGRAAALRYRATWLGSFIARFWVKRWLSLNANDGSSLRKRSKGKIVPESLDVVPRKNNSPGGQN